MRIHLLQQRQLWLVAAIIIGLAATGLGVGMLALWEIDLFKATTLDMDFTGLVCGTPLDHPDWARGEPCDGAVNRQSVVSAGILFSGVALIAISTILYASQSRQSDPTARR